MTALVEQSVRKEISREETTSQLRRTLHSMFSVKTMATKLTWIQCFLLGLALITPVSLAEDLQRTSSATLVIGGVVPPVVQLTVIPQPGNNQLNLVAGESDVTVATVNEKSNSAKGYTVTLTSQNAVAGSDGASLLRGINNRNNQIAYTIKYGLPGQEQDVRLQNGAAVLAKQDNRTGEAGLNKVLKITVPPAAGAAPDTYQDVLTLTLTSK